MGYVSLATLSVVAVLVLMSSVIGYRYYISIHRRSIWVDVAFLGLFAGSASWIYDIAFRGFVIDFINLPGTVTADFKDILMAVGVASVIAEVIDNPKLSLSWKGWRREGKNLIQLAESVARFSIKEICSFGQFFQGCEED